MNSTYPTRRRSSASSRRTSLSASVAALAASMLTLSSSDLHAATGTWQANPADQGVSVTITVGSAWTVTPALQEGDAVRVGTLTGLGLGTSDNYYYVVGVGSTPSTTVRFSQSASANTFPPQTGVELVVTKTPSWNTAGNWVSGIIPSGIDDQAVLTGNANTYGIMLERDVTLGDITVDTTSSGANGISLFGTARNGGAIATLTLQRSSGTPTLTLTGGKSFSFSESKITGNTPGGTNAKLAVLGTQGLFIDNQNLVATPVAVNVTAINTSPTYPAGAMRFGFGLDWTNFSGDLTLARGVFQPLAGGALNANLTSLPMKSKVVLGTENNVARMEIVAASGQTVIRGLESTSSNSSVINTSTALPASSIGLLTLELGSYGQPSDNFTYAGNIGNSANIDTVASSSSIRLVKAGPGTQTLSGINNLNASTANAVLVAVNGGKLSLGPTGAIGTITGGQGAANADSSVVIKNGEFELSGLGVASPRSQAFGGHLIFGNVAPSTASSDDKQAAQSNSHSTLTVIADPAQPATLTFGTLKPRKLSASPVGTLVGTTMLYRGSNLGGGTGAGFASIKFTTPPTVGGGSLFTVNGSGTLGTAQAPVLKGALADSSPTGNGTSFATYDTVTGVRPLTSSEQTSVTSGSAYNSAPSDDNIKIDLAGDISITGHSSNTLQINNTTLLPATVTNSGTDLYPANGLLFTGTAPITLSGGQINGTAGSNSEDVVIHSVNSGGVTIQTAISNPGQLGGDVFSTAQGWITYSGIGDFRLEGEQSAGNTGGLAFNTKGTVTIASTVNGASNFCVNRGIVKLDTNAQWTTVPRLIVADGARFDLNGIGSTATTNRYSDINAPIIASGLVVNPIAGEITNTSGTTVDLILSGALNGPSSQATSTAFFGTVTGNLNLIVDKSTFNTGTGVFAYGTQFFANTNTYTGATHIRSGTLSLYRGGRLPVTTTVTLGVTDSNANSTLGLGENQGSMNGAVRQEIAGLYAAPKGTGTGIATVINNSSNLSVLTLNIADGVDNIYTGNLGVDPATVSNGDRGAPQNLFSLRKIGAGSFEASGVLTNYTGGTIIEGGILRASSDAKLGQVGPLIGIAAAGPSAPLAPISAFANQIILNGGTLQTTTTPDFVLDAKRGIGLGPTSGSTGGTGTLWVDSGVNLSYSGIIASAGNTGTQTLVKQGSGTLSLNGASTFTGTVQVSGGTLAGTGSLASGLTINSGGAVAPGNAGVGTLAFGGDLTLNTGGALNLDLAAPGTSDLLVIGGTVSASGTTTVNISALSGFADGTYTLITASAPINASNFVTGTGVPVGKRGVFSSVGNTLSVTISDAPALSDLENWRLTNFGNSANSGNGADAADPDSDGLANLVEYATGTNPNAAGTSVITAGRNGNFLSLSYTRIADTSLTYTVEGTSDFVTWATVTTSNNPSTGAQNVAGQVVVEDTVSIASAPGRRFLRLKVSR